MYKIIIILFYFTVNILSIANGSACAWLSPAIPILTSTDNVILKSGAISTDQISWLGSLPGLGASTSIFFSTFISQHFGLKNTIVVFSIPLIVGTCYLY